MEKIYLGRHTQNGAVYLEKHKWDCGWYWAFGYIGNHTCHWHISAMIEHPKEYCPDWTNISYHFSDTWLTQNQWWILRDLFIQAYALKEAAETYQYGGHQIQAAAPYRITSKETAEILNKDLGKLLDSIWNLLTQWNKEHTD